MSSNPPRFSLRKSEVFVHASRRTGAAFLEEAMNKTSMVLGLVLSTLLFYLHADTKGRVQRSMPDRHGRDRG